MAQVFHFIPIKDIFLDKSNLGYITIKDIYPDESNLDYITMYKEHIQMNIIIMSYI